MYVDVIHLKKTNSNNIQIVERSSTGERIYKEFPVDHHFYIDHPNGDYTTIYGTKVQKLSPSTAGEKHKLLAQYRDRRTWESDPNLIFRCLEQNYLNSATPHLQTAFFDIETDFDPIRGYSSAEDALNPITSVAVYLQWMDKMFCFAVPPKTLSWNEAVQMTKDMDDVILCKTEKEMLLNFIDVIDDADVVAGWNSDLYDIPYTVNRVVKVAGKAHLRKMCLWSQYPKRREIERGGKILTTYDLIGRMNVDYMDLYKKYTYEERHSYALNAIAELELGDKKVEYNGTLDDLYNKEFRKFLEYNIQDTYLLHKLDVKLQYIDLCNTIAHASCVPMPSAMGTVAITDQSITIEAHSRNLVVPDKAVHEGDTRAAGGWVAFPKKGLHKWVGSSDLNSLYPSVIRALNMSPETIVAQVDISGTMQEIAEWEAAASSHTFGNWWNDRFCPLEMQLYFDNDKSELLTLRFEDGNEVKLTGADLRKLIFESDQPWAITANGTIFRYDKVGVIPGLLTRWYAERKELQAIKRNYQQLEDNEKSEGFVIRSDSGITNDDLTEHSHHSSPYDQQTCFNLKLFQSLVEENNKDKLVDYLNQHKLYLQGNKVIYRDQEELKKIVGFWDKKQLVSKLSLNGLYGCILNPGSRFFDQRLGQSTTLTGRNITKHMTAKTNDFITGVYDHYGECVIYGDSVTADSIIETSIGSMTIEDLFDDHCDTVLNRNGREYAVAEDIKIMSYDPDIDEAYSGNFSYIYRHEVTKDIYEIEDELGNRVKVTEDHSIMVERDGIFEEVKPADLIETDILISLEKRK